VTADTLARAGAPPDKGSGPGGDHPETAPTPSRPHSRSGMSSVHELDHQRTRTGDSGDAFCPAAAMHRRRTAALRLVGLDYLAGASDPLDCLAARSYSVHAATAWAYVRPPAENLAVLRADDMVALKVFLTDMGWPAVWSHQWGGWLVYATELPDLDAAARYRGTWHLRRGLTRADLKAVAS